MAQLTDDCFAFSGPLMPIVEMERLITERVTPLAGASRVQLGRALGRVLADDLVAPINLPPFANSAVDGYAVRHADLSPNAETRLVVSERLTAGRAAAQPIAAQAAVRIFTGAPMPDGADTVFMQEDVREESGRVVLPPGLKQGANRRLAGEDIVKGAGALRGGTRLKPADIALIAALGLTALRVRPRVRAALFSTGDELSPAGARLKRARIYDANRPLIAALLGALGARVTDLGILPDRPKTLRDALAMAATDHDLIVTSGGVSTGEADHVRGAVEAAGTLVFWRIGIKPGRPVAMGVLPGLAPGGGAAFVGLPGNPAAVFVTFARVVRPLLLRLAGARPEPLVAFPVRAGFDYRKKAGRREYVRAKLDCAPDGVLTAQKHPREGAGVITSLTETDGLVELAEDVTEVKPGASVGFIPYSALVG
jgi:molybdopterin molybdotransferase